MSRLPISGADDGVWGLVLNDFLLRAHNADGTIRPIDMSQVKNLSAAIDSINASLNSKLSQADVSGKADDSKVVHNDRNETLAGALTFPEQPARTGQLIMHSVNDPGGFVQKNIVFQDEGVLSRGGPVWIDAAGRVQAWLGWHDQIPGGSSHHGVEVKTASDPSGGAPNNLVTRFRLKSDADQTQAAFYSCQMLYIENGIYSPDTQFGITFNTPQSGSVALGTSSGIYELGKLTFNVDSTGEATMDLGVGLDNTTGAHIRMFRDSNVPTANLALYAADGTSTTTFFIDAKTGGVTQAGRLQYKTTGNIVMFNQTPIIDGSGHTIVDNDVMTQDASHNATYRVFRNTNTSQTRSFRILKGDGTNTDSFVVNAGTGDVTVTGDLNVSGNITANNLFDEFELRRSSNVSSLNRLLASSSLTLTASNLFGAIAYAKTGGTFTKIRFATASGTQSATDLRLGVYNSANTLLASTVNLSGTVTAASTLYDNLALDTSVIVTAGQQLWLAIGYTGTSLSVRGVSLTTGMPGLSPVISKATAYAGGTLPSLGSGNTQQIPWIELVP
ncbi:MAG TPA: hypothetical protein VLA88_04365 [Candidatus Saccharimonadales bacterium]|nr:hypothetical protein [Candidatus Saccharimonadales bacterium]